jgi:hypothetical protein
MDVSRRKTNGVDADGEVVWFRYPDADIKTAQFTPMTGATKPGPRGEREGNR